MTPTSSTAPVTVFGADWCGDCRRSKIVLDRLQVNYNYVDLETQPHHYDEVLRRNGGRRSIPVVVFPDDSHLTEPSARELSERLGDLGLVHV